MLKHINIILVGMAVFRDWWIPKEAIRKTFSRETRDSASTKSNPNGRGSRIRLGFQLQLPSKDRF